MKRNAAALAGMTGAISVVTVVNRLGAIDVRTLAASPQQLADGRVWLLLTSAVLADKPAVASILGFLVVGLAALALCGGRVLWISALLGHVGAAVVVYLGIGLIRDVHHGAYQGAVTYPDYGTSAMIAAWVGAVAYTAWVRRRRAPALALVAAAAAIGWLCKGSLTVLDTEHAFALVFGAAAAGFVPTFRLLPAGKPQAASPTT